MLSESTPNSEAPAAITKQDRLDAIENIERASREYSAELAVVAALDQHSLDLNGSRNLGYYRTFIECSCGVGWWFGVHEGDPSAEDRWAVHRAKVLADAVLAAGYRPQEAGRLSPEFRADLVDFAAQRIQAVWDDAGAVDAVTLAQNVVMAQEFAWLTHQFPVAAPVTEEAQHE